VSLVDTGSSHCLISTETLKNINNVKNFKIISMNMSVAGATLTDNIVGKVTFVMRLLSIDGIFLSYSQEFLFAHNINGYEAILGANFLLNPKIPAAITPHSLLLHYNTSIE
jgi:hypothetical protein